ncbi:MAG: hypothetical protein BECKG1743F_GA0114225_111221, partial [Candidatus Kentron sp. G]
RVISGVASHIQVEETEALHVSRIALISAIQRITL